MNSDLFLYKIQLKTTVHPLTGCWVYPGKWNRKKYPRCKVDGSYVRIHQTMYSIFNGPPTNWVLHACNNRACVNPNHLYDGTPKDNFDDMVKAGTFKGQAVRYTPEERRKLRRQRQRAWLKRKKLNA